MHTAYSEPEVVANMIGYAMHRNRSHDAVICAMKLAT